MRSARLFLPLSMSLFMKRVRVRLPKRGSGGTSRFTTRARRGMDTPWRFEREPFSSGTEDHRLSRAVFVQVPGWLRGLLPAVLRADPICLGSPCGQPPHEAGYLAGALGAFAPYFDRPCLRSLTPPASSAPRTMWYRTPGRSLTRPPRTSTIECSCKLWPSPGMYAVTSTPLDRRTRATLRSAELGFFGVMILTCRQTPFFCGQPCRAGCLGFRYCCRRGLRTSWLIVGIGPVVPIVSIRPSPLAGESLANH